MPKPARVPVELQREGVCFADDIDTPHPQVIDVRSQANVVQVLRRAMWIRYLPLIQGGSAYWVARVDEVAVAVVQQRWLWWSTKLLVAGKTPLSALTSSTPPVLAFDYHAQTPPRVKPPKHQLPG